MMNEEHKGANTSERQHEAKEHRQVWNKCALIAAANGSQYDQAISENAGKDPEHDLRDAAAHEVPQDA